MKKENKKAVIVLLAILFVSLIACVSFETARNDRNFEYEKCHFKYDNSDESLLDLCLIQASK